MPPTPSISDQWKKTGNNTYHLHHITPSVVVADPKMAIKWLGKRAQYLIDMNPSVLHVLIMDTFLIIACRPNGVRADHLFRHVATTGVQGGGNGIFAQGKSRENLSLENIHQLLQSYKP